MLKSIRYIFNNVDTLFIWIILLLFNFKFYGFYIINYVALLLFLKSFLKNKFRVNTLINITLIILFAGVGYLQSGFYLEPFKYIFNFFQIFIFYNYFQLRFSKKIDDEYNFIKSLIEFLTFLYLLLGFVEFKNGSVLWFESRNYDLVLPRINLGFGDSNSLAAFLILFSGLFFNYKLFKQVFTFLVGALTFSRSFLISFIIYFIFQYRKNAILIVTIIIMLYLFGLYFNVFEDYAFAFNRLSESGSVEDPRISEWILTLNNISILPDWSIFKVTLDPHNSFLLALNLVGPIGFCSIFYLLYFYFRKLIVYTFKSNTTLTLLMFLIFCFFNSELFSIRNTAALGMVLGILNPQRI
jgi:hypothetical protein